MSKIETFLKKIGLKSDQISKLTGDEDAPIDEIVKAFKDAQKDVIANDPDFIQPIKDEIRGTEISKMEHKIKKQFGLTSDEIKDKKFDEILAIASEKTKQSISSTADDLQSKIIELTKENKRLQDEVIPAKENEAKEVIKSFKKDSTIRSILAQKQLIVSPEVVLPAIQNYLNNNYNIDLADDGQFQIKTKQGLNPLNEDGTKVIGFDEILENQLKSLNVLKQSNGVPEKNQSKPATIIEKNIGDNKFNLPGFEAAKENAERMKNIRTFGN